MHLLGKVAFLHFDYITIFIFQLIKVFFFKPMQAIKSIAFPLFVQEGNVNVLLKGEFCCFNWNILLLLLLLSRSSHVWLCDPIDGSPPGSAVPGILQARTLEWVAISFSNAWKWKVKVKSLSRVRLSVIPWTAAYPAPPSMGFSRQEYWSEVPLPSLEHPMICHFPHHVSCERSKRKKQNKNHTLKLTAVDYEWRKCNKLIKAPLTSGRDDCKFQLNWFSRISHLCAFVVSLWQGVVFVSEAFMQ